MAEATEDLQALQAVGTPPRSSLYPLEYSRNRVACSPETGLLLCLEARIAMNPMIPVGIGPQTCIPSDLEQLNFPGLLDYYIFTFI
jgi:hypothetical protein